MNAADVVARLRAAGCVFAEEEARLLIDESRNDAELAARIDRRAAGEPLESILGWAEFCGLRVAVAPGVFVPRRRTQAVVRTALALLDAAPADPGRRPVVVDLCCGSGAIGLAVATARAVELHAADIDPRAVGCARANLAGTGTVYQGDLDAPLPARLRGRVDLLLANAPYVPSGQIPLMPPEARDREPAVALDGGADGLDLHRRIAAAAPGWLAPGRLAPGGAAPGGALVVEIAGAQVAGAVALVEAAGLIVDVRRDEDVDGTVVVGRREPGEARARLPRSRPAGRDRPAGRVATA